MVTLRLLLILLFSLPVAAVAGEVRLSAAASLTEVVRELCDGFAATQAGHSCVLNTGGSGTLARQIVAGAPADLFLSASRDWTEHLARVGLVASLDIVPFAGNRLVFVGRPGAAASLADVARLPRIALGSPKSVPAGAYAEQALRAQGLYDGLERTGSLVFAQDVRQALAYADRGAVDGAFVYRTDAALAQQARILFEVPASLHAPIDYPLALTATGAANPAARALFGYLRSPAAREMLLRHGFSVPEVP